VAGYYRGIELYGALASRLNEPALKESLSKYGLIVVEGMNDVIRLDELNLCAVGLTSNRATDTQVASLVQFAQQVSNNRILLLPDCDEEGESGFKDLLWKLAEAQVQIRLGPTSKSQNGQFAGKQPEDFILEDFNFSSTDSAGGHYAETL
jgi:5S rRNA maturation endonuclease (ribonuclease M5)